MTSLIRSYLWSVELITLIYAGFVFGNKKMMRRSDFFVGAGIFITTIVAGTVSIIRPFEAMQRPLLRDVIFSIATAFFVFYILYTRTVTFVEAIGKSADTLAQFSHWMS